MFMCLSRSWAPGDGVSPSYVPSRKQAASGLIRELETMQSGRKYGTLRLETPFANFSPLRMFHG